MKKLSILFAVALFALFFASCSKDDDSTPSTSSNSQGNGDAAGCFETSGQLINRETKEPYTGGGKVYMAERQSGTGNVVITDETALLVGAVNNGKITFNCPENVDSRFLMGPGNNVPAGVSIDHLDVEVWLYSDALRLIDDNGVRIGNIDYMKLNDTEAHVIRHSYFSKEVKINGLDPNENIKWEINAKKGWNKIYQQWPRNEESTSSVLITTDLSKAPDGLEWTIYLY